MLENKYQSEYLSIKESLKKIEFFSFTTDLWTNKNKKKSFLSLTAHFIENYQRNWRVLATEEFLESKLIYYLFINNNLNFYGMMRPILQCILIKY